MSHKVVDCWIFEFVVDRAAVLLGGGAAALTVEPLYIVNKANLGDCDRRRGSERWQEVLAFEAAIRLTAAKAKRQQALDLWPMDALGYHVHIAIEFGDRLIVVDGRKAARKRAKNSRERMAIDFSWNESATFHVEPKARKPHTRRDRAERRCAAYGVDSIKAVLDALEGVVYHADEQAGGQSSSKVARPDGRLGDRLRIRIELSAGILADDPDRLGSDAPPLAAGRQTLRA
jgi:hypothetical protein